MHILQNRPPVGLLLSSLPFSHLLPSHPYRGPLGATYSPEVPHTFPKGPPSHYSVYSPTPLVSCPLPSPMTFISPSLIPASLIPLLTPPPPVPLPSPFPYPLGPLTSPHPPLLFPMTFISLLIPPPSLHPPPPPPPPTLTLFTTSASSSPFWMPPSCGHIRAPSGGLSEM
ncbi:uncharacterized protein [Macrobrachium rosenbergii]|uniref:uncharacterized protein n=1 Tax=Macrobrachium rosenbergii TaxID=79674 RepID=UPI0034D4AB6E